MDNVPDPALDDVPKQDNQEQNSNEHKLYDDDIETLATNNKDDIQTRLQPNKDEVLDDDNLEDNLDKPDTKQDNDDSTNEKDDLDERLHPDLEDEVELFTPGNNLHSIRITFSIRFCITFNITFSIRF